LFLIIHPIIVGYGLYRDDINDSYV
jgi:hypothetical protein